MENVRHPVPLHYIIFPQAVVRDKNSMDDKDVREKVYSYKKGRGSERVYTTKSPACSSTGERRCEDGTCIARVELCPEEQLMNQNTILIMIVVGLAVVIFLVILYCFQQRQRRASQALGTETGLSEDCDNASLYAPPPSYEDVMSSNLYLPTEEHRRLQLLSTAEESLTPPPNYDAALILLAQSQDSALNKPRRNSSVFRRSVSMENVNGDETQNRCSQSQRNENSNSSKKDKKKNIFRYSGHFTRTSLTRGTTPTSPRTFSSALPPYSPPIYPITPPPPITPSPTTVSPAPTALSPAPNTVSPAYRALSPAPGTVHTEFIMPDARRQSSPPTIHESPPTIQESPNENEVLT